MRIVYFTARHAFRAIHLSVRHIDTACAAILRGIKTCRLPNTILILKSALDGWRLANVIEPTGSRLARRTGIALYAAFPAIVRIIVDIRTNGIAVFNTYFLALGNVSARIGFILAQSRRKYAFALTAGPGHAFINCAIGLAIPTMLRIGLQIPAPALAFILRAAFFLLRVIRAATK